MGHKELALPYHVALMGEPQKRRMVSEHNTQAGEAQERNMDVKNKSKHSCDF
jgi:hypothetical protein